MNTTPESITRDELARALNMMIMSPEHFTLVPASVPVPQQQAPAGPPYYAPAPPFGPPGYPSYPPAPPQPYDHGPGAMIHDGESLAAQLFEVIRTQREEAGRWVTGAIYQSEATGEALTGPDAGRQVTTICLYRREENGWFCYGSNDRLRDGQCDTRGFQQLVPVDPVPEGGQA